MGLNMRVGLWGFFLLFNLEAHMMHQREVGTHWQEEGILPFDELMLSWNAARPLQGKYLFYVSVKTEDWSPWLLYAAWGSDGQSSFHEKADQEPVRVYQDALEVLEGQKATGFQIKVVPEGLAVLEDIHALHVYTNGDRLQDPKQMVLDVPSIGLSLPGISQMVLNHERPTSLCSPTSTTSVVRYLLNCPDVDPVYFAQNVWDGGFDIFGNWVFSVAQAATELGKDWNCWVERLAGFEAVYQRLQQGAPVVVSIRGPLTGSAQPYASGHLIAVIGYDSLRQRVLCMDPAFPADDQTLVSYDLLDFTQAWNRRGRVAYVFQRSPEISKPF